MRLISPYRIQVKNSQNNKGKGLKQEIDEIEQEANLTTTITM